MHEFSRSRTKISEYGKHAPVVVRGFVQVELLKDLSHVRLQRLRADHEPFGDCAVRAAFSAMLMGLALALRLARTAVDADTARLTEAETGLRAAIDELRDLARGRVLPPRSRAWPSRLRSGLSNFPKVDSRQ
jgi:hypothetical protein